MVEAQYAIGEAGREPLVLLDHEEGDALGGDGPHQLAHSLGDGPAAVVIKHANPCGAAVADDILTAYTRAHECDPVSAYGGIVAVNRPVTVAVAGQEQRTVARIRARIR